MMLFVICRHCKKDIDIRETLDICQFVKWTCPFCGERNDPVGRNITEEAEVLEESGLPLIVEQVVIEIAEIDPANMEGSII